MTKNPHEESTEAAAEVAEEPTGEAGEELGAAGPAEPGTSEPAAASEDDDTPGHVDHVAPPETPGSPEEELEVLRDRHLRLAAEFDNYRRRTRSELFRAGEAARADLASHLLEIIDDLKRVAESPCDPEQHEAMHQGVGLIARKLVKTLADAGVEAINPAGERFDPNLHEALTIQPTDDPEQDEVVATVVLEGYRLGDRLLRPAQVIVYRYQGESA